MCVTSGPVRIPPGMRDDDNVNKNQKRLVNYCTFQILQKRHFKIGLNEQFTVVQVVELFMRFSHNIFQWQKKSWDILLSFVETEAFNRSVYILFYNPVYWQCSNKTYVRQCENVIILRRTTTNSRGLRRRVLWPRCPSFSEADEPTREFLRRSWLRVYSRRSDVRKINF